MAVADVDPSALDARTLAFRLAPRINAAGRLRRADAGVELLLTGDERRAAQIAAELDEANAERRTVERHIDWEADAQVSQLGERTAYVLAGGGWHPGVIGIVASRIVERYHRPTLLVALEDGGLCRGSGRSVPGFDLLGALHECAEHLERYGGHRAAAGLTVRTDRIGPLSEAFERHAEAVLTPEMLVPLHAVDAVASGSELGLTLAEELELLEPCGIGNPRPRLLVPGARFGDLRPMGETGRHARFTVAAGGTITPAVAFGCEGRLQARPGEPVDAIFFLERNFWRGAVAPRLVLGGTWPCSPEPIEMLGEPGDYFRGVLDELDRPLEGRLTAPSAPTQPFERAVLDRRGESPLAVLSDALAAGGPLLALCADAARRLPGLASRIGGFALITYHALESDPRVADRFEHLVALDPPAGAVQSSVLALGAGYTHLGWGTAELRFAQQMHELEYGLRASLVAFYRGLRSRARVAGQELEHLLRGEGPHGRPARLAGRLIRVLAELELVSLDRDLPALAIAGRAPTALDRSAAYRVYTQRYEDGQRFLSSNANPPVSSPTVAVARAR
jgi:single-stranded-DNA-specific exonuclease